jgi:hypothetical protein
MRLSSKLFKLVLAAVFALGNVACSGDDIFSGLGGRKKKSDGDDLGDGDSDGKHTKAIANSGASFQVKDVLLLRNSIDSCMGPGKLEIKEDMLMPADLAATDPGPDGRFRFLLPVQFAAGDDIIEKERKNLVDQERGTRTGIAADSLTDTYLRSLETIANVVAHHCEDGDDNCACDSKSKAREIIVRCLPAFDPDTPEMDEAAELLGLICKDDSMRKGIASLLSSYAFASAR